MAVLKVLLVISTIAIVGSEPFFGNDFVVPQRTRIIPEANCVVNNLVSARNSLNSYIRSPPTSSESLRQGVSCLALYVANVTKLEGDIFTEIARASNDRTSNPAVICSKLNGQIRDLKPLLANSTSYIACIQENFDTSNDNITSTYYKKWNDDLVKRGVELEQILGNMCRAIEANHGKVSTTQDFLTILMENNTLPLLENITMIRCAQASDLARRAGEQNIAINQANSFRSTINSRILSSRNSATSSVNSYITSSNSSANSVFTSSERFATFVRTTDDAFFFRWPQALNKPVLDKRALLNHSVVMMSNKMQSQKEWVQAFYLNVRELLSVQNPAQAYLMHEAELTTRIMLNIIRPNHCVMNFRTRLTDLPAQVQTQLNRCTTNQVTMDRNVATQVVSIVNSVLQPYVTVVYSNGEICHSYPFDKMNTCLDNVSIGGRG